MSALALPEGWKREEMKRSIGLATGKVDIVYISPSGRRIKSKLELAKHLGPSIDLSNFDYRTGKINQSLVRKNNKRASVRAGNYDYRSLRNDPSLTPPSRQTSSIFGQSARVYRSQSESTVMNAHQIREYFKKKNMPIDWKVLETSEKPFQVLWAKRLEGERAFNIDTGEAHNFNLPANMKTFSRSALIDTDTLVRSVTASLNCNTTIRGQEKNVLERRRRWTHEENYSRDPTAFINPSQPLIVDTTLSEDDIRRQEDIVRRTRNKLKLALEQCHLLV